MFELACNGVVWNGCKKETFKQWSMPELSDNDVSHLGTFTLISYRQNYCGLVCSAPETWFNAANDRLCRYMGTLVFTYTKI